jgi:hypothetical protein
MSQPSSFGSTLLEEAGSVDTSPQRLHELFEADPSLGSVIASNPSASIQLLDQLAVQFPAEVLANPALQLLSLEAERVYGAFSLRSLVCLSLSSELKQETQVLEETKRRMHEALDQLRSQEMVGLSCVWLWRRAFTLQPQDFDGLIDQELDLSLEHRAFVDGDMGDICSAIPQLACDDPNLVQSQIAEVASFLRAIDDGTLNSYVDSRVDPDGEREHKGDSDTLLSILGDNGRYSTEGSLLIKDQPILEFHALINEFNLISYKDGIVWVAAGEHEEIDREYHLSLGELQQLYALCEHSACIPEAWHHSLASLLIA